MFTGTDLQVSKMNEFWGWRVMFAQEYDCA